MSRQQALTNLLQDERAWRSTLERLERYHEVVPGPLETPCHFWTRSTDDDGYGQIVITSLGLSVTVRAHRVAYILDKGDLPDAGTPHVLHRCDNPACINDEHLYEGTIAQNNRDKKERGRNWVNHPQGTATRRERSALTEEKVANMRRLYETGRYSYADLGKMFCISKSYVGAIVRKEHWYDA